MFKKFMLCFTLGISAGLLCSDSESDTPCFSNPSVSPKTPIFSTLFFVSFPGRSVSPKTPEFPVSVEGNSSFMNRSFRSESSPKSAGFSARPVVVDGRRVYSNRSAVVRKGMDQIFSPTHSHGMSPETKSPFLATLPAFKMSTKAFECKNEHADKELKKHEDFLNYMEFYLNNPGWAVTMAQFRTDLLAYQAKEDAWFANSSK